jgi:hypothetical protein
LQLQEIIEQDLYDDDAAVWNDYWHFDGVMDALKECLRLREIDEQEWDGDGLPVASWHIHPPELAPRGWVRRVLTTA